MWKLHKSEKKEELSGKAPLFLEIAFSVNTIQLVL
jgi:hypothetical protein